MQYLVLIQPFRTWLSEETGQPECVSEYLWHDGRAIWTDDRMTKVLLAHSAEAIGVRLNIQAWRQLAVGIAIKKFSQQGYQLDLDIPADRHAGAETEGLASSKAGQAGSMLEVLH